MMYNIKPENGKKQFKIYMSRAKENIEAAEILFEKKSYRGAVSRAYYGFFEAASAALITKGFFAKTHAGVIYLFEQHFVRTNEVPAKFSRFFREAKEAREEADYKFLEKTTKEDAERIIKTAKEFIEVIEKSVKV
ncbi:HEPN domain-containing protein [Patescibacteria group bacterium]|nr:HEPN domain-containing protein [Patescibacteria group bacterium]MBU4512635.1 HEPN domain-containing protein [Patescibacteria group bacterium]MCG2693541.1 HEPN domain-containing protein [Candidatus Parcubacteria bacterium]